MGPLVDYVNFYAKSTDCFTNLDNTPNDFRLPFGITNIGLFFMAILVIFFLNVEVPKPEKKLSFREEFSWVRNSYKFLLSRFGTCEFWRFSSSVSHLAFHPEAMTPSSKCTPRRSSAPASRSSVAPSPPAWSSESSCTSLCSTPVHPLPSLPFGKVILARVGTVNLFALMYILISVSPVYQREVTPGHPGQDVCLVPADALHHQPLPGGRVGGGRGRQPGLGEPLIHVPLPPLPVCPD